MKSASIQLVASPSNFSARTHRSLFNETGRKRRRCNIANTLMPIVDLTASRAVSTVNLTSPAQRASQSNTRA